MPKISEHKIIEKYILSDDISFINHYKAEDNGIICKESLNNRFEIYDNVKKYKNVLEAYDKGKRNTMLQIKSESNDSGEIINTNIEKISERTSKDTIDEEIK